MSRRGNSRRQPPIAAALGIAVAAGVWAVFTWVPLFSQFELHTLDLRYRLRPPIRTAPELGTIDIDAATLDLAGAWPVPRGLYAELSRLLHDHDARLMPMDVFFPDPSPLTVAPARMDEARRLASGAETAPELARLLDEMARGPDEIIAEAFRATGLAVLAQTFWTADPAEYRFTEAIDVKTRAMAANALSDSHRRSVALADRFSVPYPAASGRNDTIARAYFVEPPVPLLLEAAAGLGFAQTIVDADGSVRRYPLLMHYAGRLYPSLALMSVSLAAGVPLDAMEVTPGNFVLLPGARVPGPDGLARTADIRVPVDRFLRMSVNWAGDYLDTFIHFPARLLLAFRADDVIRERIRAYGRDAAALISDGAERIAAEVARRSLLPAGEARLAVRNLLLARIAELALETDGPGGRDGFLDDYADADDAETRALLGSIWDRVADANRLLALLRGNPDEPADGLAGAIGPSGPVDTALLHTIERLRFALKRGKDPETLRPLYFDPPVEVASGAGRTLRLSPLDLADKILFVGLTATGTHDFNPMPFSGRYPMVGLHVNAANTILTGRFIRETPRWASLLIVLLCSLPVALAAGRLHPVMSFFVTAGLSAAYALAAQQVFNREGLWLPMTAPPAAAAATYLCIVARNVLTERREKKRVRSAFSKFVTPAVVSQMLKNPDMLRLGGEKRTMTVFFSDVRGFTTISEAFSPEETVALLNEYIGRMTGVIFRHSGTLDKYQGDGIMAFWNAPLDQADHAHLACCAALDSVRELETVLCPKWAAEGKPQLAMRIGLNTGPMVVGNLGSSERMAYSVMGDAVNVGARLEPVNKIFGTKIIISEYTRALAAGRIADRELGVVRLKGRKQPVRVYELIGRAGDIPPDAQKLCSLFQDGMRLYAERRWAEAMDAFNAALSVRAGDGPSRLYLQLCAANLANPPGDGWTGEIDTA